MVKADHTCCSLTGLLALPWSLPRLPLPQLTWATPAGCLVQKTGGSGRVHSAASSMIPCGLSGSRRWVGPRLLGAAVSTELRLRISLCVSHAHQTKAREGKLRQPRISESSSTPEILWPNFSFQCGNRGPGREVSCFSLHDDFMILLLIL